jgi:hypothetical protein
MDNAGAAWLLSSVRPAGLRTAVLSLLISGIARGDEYAEAERDERSFDFGAALAHYEAAVSAEPTSARAAKAQLRIDALRAHSEGEFEPLAKLERVRRSAELGADARAIDELVRAAEGFPAGLVRVEAWMLAAEAYANRLGRPDDAAALWKRIAVDPHADDVVVKAATRALVVHYIARDELSRAEDIVERAGTNIDAQSAREVRRLVRRRKVHIASIAAIGLAVAGTVLAIVRAARGGRLRTIVSRTRAVWKLIAGYAAYVALAGALLANGYEHGTGRPFLIFGGVLAPLLFLARAWGAAGAPTRAARTGRAMLCFASALGAAFLVLEGIDSSYLRSLGL